MSKKKGKGKVTKQEPKPIKKQTKQPGKGVSDVTIKDTSITYGPGDIVNGN